MDEIDKLLAEIKHEYMEASAQPQQTHAQCPNIRTSQVVSSPDKLVGIDKLLADVKIDFDEKDLAIERKRQQELEAERIRVLEEKQKKRSGLKQQAQAWLSELEPLSVEGLWFESFSLRYASKLDAAIEYLEGLEG
ncbi:hypothetical protein NIES4071_12720 [Calothrix sp. NIES-4071]|nr:hypothetical protein NIES4071_12720 [Calothrix sp. NIES-4071]BAZ55612.1 hypothetical protein NIES4105_12680 [Calothrix sp. NIES-4105]